MQTMIDDAPAHQMATITKPVQRGSKVLTLSSTAGIQPGMWLSFGQTDVRGSLQNDMNHYLYKNYTISAGPGPIVR